MFDIPDIFDGIGEALAESLFKDGTWIPAGGAPVPVKVDFEAPYLKVDVFGQPVESVEAFAEGLVTTFRTAQAGDVLIIGPYRWRLKSNPQPYGGANLCRMDLTGPIPG